MRTVTNSKDSVKIIKRKESEELFIEGAFSFLEKVNHLGQKELDTYLKTGTTLEIDSTDTEDIIRLLILASTNSFNEDPIIYWQQRKEKGSSSFLDSIKRKDSTFQREWDRAFDLGSWEEMTKQLYVYKEETQLSQKNYFLEQIQIYYQKRLEEQIMKNQIDLRYQEIFLELFSKNIKEVQNKDKIEQEIENGIKNQKRTK